VSLLAADAYFYEPAAGHGLPHDPFKAIVSPRPIGWISTLDEQGRVNLAPYSFFNAVSTDPPVVLFSSEGMKHSASNAAATGEFVASLASMPLLHAMNATSAQVEAGVNEFEIAGLTEAPSRLVRPPRVAESPAALECRVVSIQPLPTLQRDDSDRYLVIGQVVGVHIAPEFLRDGLFDTAGAQPLARCGYRDYAVVSEVFQLTRPGGA
jgi:flavin reductase (DIM6/NTAB) family NADH-FMN oxidoreductase RutF